MPNEAVVHVIDDDEAIRESLAFLLESADIDVRTYESANRFLEELTARDARLRRHRHPHAGRLRGIDLLRQLKTMGVPLPVIVITGHADVPLAVEAMKSGAVDFIEKPFDDEAVPVDHPLGAAPAREGRPARGGVGARSTPASPPCRAASARSGRAGGRLSQQDHRVRPRHFGPHGRDLPRQRHDQDAGEQPVRSGAHGAGGRRARPRQRADSHLNVLVAICRGAALHGFR